MLEYYLKDFDIKHEDAKVFKILKCKDYVPDLLDFVLIEVWLYLRVGITLIWLDPSIVFYIIIVRSTVIY
jgi:hypothetical protein